VTANSFCLIKVFCIKYSSGGSLCNVMLIVPAIVNLFNIIIMTVFNYDWGNCKFCFFCFPPQELNIKLSIYDLYGYT